MRIELTIKTDYLPEWGVWEGVRELVQNARDAETEFGAPMSVRHRPDTNTLVIENEGTTLPHEALLLGFTSKSGRSDMIGKFGEGLKLGILALVRKGAQVKIRSGSEVWVPRIVKSEKFDANVLAFDIHKGRKDDNRLQVEIVGIDTESWMLIRNKFLFLQKPKDRHCKATISNGTLLTGPEHQGMVYVRGIHVFKSATLRYGYDLPDCEIDRDRKMVDPASLRWRLAYLWKSAVNEQPELVDEYIELLDGQSTDLEGLDSYTAKHLADNVRSRITNRFLLKHGENALPVSSLSESAEVQHLGIHGVVVPSALRAVLEAQLGTIEENKEQLKFQPKHVYSWGDLSAQEQKNLTSAIALVNTQDAVSLADIDVVDFRDETFEGLFSDGRVKVARRMLKDADATLTVVVHEVAHKHGGDGEKAHVENIEKIWGGIVRSLRSK